MANNYVAKEPAANILLLLERLLEGGDTVKVREQDQTTPPFQSLMMSHLNENIVLSSVGVIDTNTLSLEAGHGFEEGDTACIWWKGTHEQMRVTSVDGNTITLDTYIAHPYTIEDTKIVRGKTNMAVNGSSSDHKHFYMQPFNMTEPLDINTIVITIQSGNSPPDDGKFGGIGALDEGLFFRLENGKRFNLGNYTKNLDFKNKGAFVEYTDSAPAGAYSTNIVFDLKKIFGVIIRLDPNSNDKIKGCVRDTLLADGITGMYISFIGQITTGEA